MLRRLRVRREGVTGPAAFAKDPIRIHGMRLDGILLADQGTVAGIELGSPCSKCEFAARVGFDKPFVIARVAREKPRCSIH